MAKKKKRVKPFDYRHCGHVIEIWLGPPDEIESEHVLSLDTSYIPALIATLRGCMGDKIDKN